MFLGFYWKISKPFKDNFLKENGGKVYRCHFDSSDKDSAHRDEFKRSKTKESFFQKT